MKTLLRRLRSERGYTLVELVTVLGILGTVVTGLTSAFVSGGRAEVDLSQRVQAQMDAVTALDRLRRDVRCASSASPASATSVTLAVPCAAGGVVKWCTAGSGGRFTLHRLASNGTCSASSPRILDFLTTGSVFAYAPPSTEHLPRLRVDLPVRVAEMQIPYRLCDILVMRNGARSGGPQAVAPC